MTDESRQISVQTESGDNGAPQRIRLKALSDGTCVASYSYELTDFSMAAYMMAMYAYGGADGRVRLRTREIGHMGAAIALVWGWTRQEPDDGQIDHLLVMALGTAIAGDNIDLPLHSYAQPEQVNAVTNHMRIAHQIGLFDPDACARLGAMRDVWDDICAAINANGGTPDEQTSERMKGLARDIGQAVPECPQHPSRLH